MAQIIAFPDSAVVVQNKVKQVSIYYTTSYGARSLQKQLQYDKSGHVIIERGSLNSYYYTYTYDSTGRQTSATQRDGEGRFVERQITTYNDSDGIKRVHHFYASDTTFATNVSTYDKHGRNTVEAYDNRLGRSYIRKYTYDEHGKIESVYDSSSATLTASFRKNDKLMWKRIYDKNGALLNAYTYGYDRDGRITSVRDSTAGAKPVRYEIQYPSNGAVQYKRNGKLMSPQEVSSFRVVHGYVFPPEIVRVSDATEPPVIENEHHFTYDKKGNILRDDLVQKWNGDARTYVYEYEYEFY